MIVFGCIGSSHARRRLIRLAIGVAAALGQVAAPASSFAQSTSQIGHAEPPLRIEVTGGGEFHASEASYGTTHDESVRSVAVALRRDRGGNGGFRLAVQGYRRRNALSYLVDTATTTHIETNDVLVALTVSSDLVIRVRHDLTLAPSVGIGFVPYIRTHQSSSPSSGYYREHINSTSEIFGGGLALRYRRLVIEQQWSALFGQPNAYDFATIYHPLMIGVRF